MRSCGEAHLSYRSVASRVGDPAGNQRLCALGFSGMAESEYQREEPARARRFEKTRTGSHRRGLNGGDMSSVPGVDAERRRVQCPAGAALRVLGGG